MKRVVLTLILIISVLLAFAGPVQELLKLAESAFDNKNYQQAKKFYNDIINLEVATPDQIDASRHNMAICQNRISEEAYNKGFQNAMLKFNSRNYVGCRSICYSLLKYPKYRTKTTRLISQCNDSIRLNQAQQQFQDSVALRNALLAEYEDSITTAYSLYRNKSFADAISKIQSTKNSRFVSVAKQRPLWVDTCLAIYADQIQGKAVSETLALTISNAYQIGNFKSGRARIITRYGYGKDSDTTRFISPLGKVVLNQKGYQVADFNNGYLVDSSDFGHGGFWDANGNFISTNNIGANNYARTHKLIYIYQVKEFSNKMAPFKDKNGKWGYLNENLDIVIGPKYDFVTSFHEGRSFVREGKYWKIIDKSGNVIMSKLWPAFRGSAYETDNGYVDKINNSYFQDGRCFVQTNKYKTLLVDLNGSTIIDFEKYLQQHNAHSIMHNGKPLYSWEHYYNNRYIYCDNNDLYGYINEKGDISIVPTYDLTYGFSEELAPVKLQDKWGFIDTMGQIVIPLAFEDVNRAGFHEGLCAVKINGKWGYINSKGKIVIEPKFDSARSFSEGFAVVQYDGLLGFVDKYGITTFDYQ